MFEASTHACSQHPRLQPAPTLAVSTHACSQHPRMQPAHASRQHPRLQAAPTLAGSTHACCHHARLQPAPNACRRDFARQRTSISPRCPAFFLFLNTLPVQPVNVLKVLHLLPTHCFLTLSEFSAFSRSKLSFSALLVSFFFGFRSYASPCLPRSRFPHVY